MAGHPVDPGYDIRCVCFLHVRDRAHRCIARVYEIACQFVPYLQILGLFRIIRYQTIDYRFLSMKCPYRHKFTVPNTFNIYSFTVSRVSRQIYFFK